MNINSILDFRIMKRISKRGNSKKIVKLSVHLHILRIILINKMEPNQMFIKRINKLFSARKSTQIITQFNDYLSQNKSTHIALLCISSLICFEFNLR
jgi:hypothetical protein